MAAGMEKSTSQGRGKVLKVRARNVQKKQFSGSVVGLFLRAAFKERTDGGW